MNRNALSRGKSENKSYSEDGWIIGYYVTDGCECGIIPLWNIQRTSNGEAMEFEYLRVDPKTVGRWAEEYESLLVPLDPRFATAVVARDTFEGDIVKGMHDEYCDGKLIQSHTFTCEVKWDNKNGRWITEDLHDGEIMDLYDTDYDSIIGNIHDNPIK